MPYPREIAWAKFRVVMVVICALSILSVLSYLLTGGSLLAAKTTLYVYLPDVTGIAKGSPVRVNGITVGKVRSVELTGSSDPLRVVRVAMTVEVAQLRSIPVDSTAEVNSDTLLGDQLIDIASGRRRETIPPEGEIALKPPSDFMKSLDIAQFEKQLRKVEALLIDLEQGKTPVGEFIKGERMYQGLLQRVTELQNGIRGATATTGQVGQLLYTQTLYEKVSRPVRELDEALARIQSGQGTAGRMLRDTGDYEKMRAGAADLRRTLQDLRTGRAAGGQWLAGDTAWTAIARTLASLMETVDRINAGPLFSTSQVYDNLDGFSRELRDSIRDFRRDPEKYMRIQVF